MTYDRVKTVCKNLSEKSLTFTFNPFQGYVVAKLVQNLKRLQVCQLPTGIGKTYIAIAIAAYYHSFEKKIAIVTS